MHLPVSFSIYHEHRSRRMLILLPDILNIYAAWEGWRGISLHCVPLRLAT